MPSMFSMEKQIKQGNLAAQSGQNLEHYCQAFCPFCVCVSKSSKWTQTDTKVTFHFLGLMKGMTFTLVL